MEIAEAIRTIVGWLVQTAGKILLFIAWFQIIKEYFFMLSILEPKENFCGENTEGFQVRDKRFFRLFLWFFTNVLLAALLNKALA